MLVLSVLQHFLLQTLDLPNLHTAILLTPAGELVSVATDSHRPKDDIYIVVSLAAEAWQATENHAYAMMESELGRIVVLPIDNPGDQLLQSSNAEYQPLMLLALNGTNAVKWEEFYSKGKVVAVHLAKPLSKFKEHLTVPKPPPSAISPAAVVQLNG